MCSSDLLALLVEDRFEGKVSRVELGVVFGLPVLMVDGLLEVTFAVEEADADEPEPEIAGRKLLEMSQHLLAIVALLHVRHS